MELSVLFLSVLSLSEVSLSELSATEGIITSGGPTAVGMSLTWSLDDPAEGSLAFALTSSSYSLIACFFSSRDSRRQSSVDIDGGRVCQSTFEQHGCRAGRR